MSKKQRILITGGCGFIGINLIKYLIKNTDWQINVLDNLSLGDKNNLKKISEQKRIFLFTGDIRNKNDVAEAMFDCTLIVNLAAQTGVPISLENPLKDAEINILGLLTILEESRRQKIKKIIHASSAAPLGNQKMPVNEDKVPAPLSPYGASKLAGEGYCSAYSESYGLPTVALRFSNIYGPESLHKNNAIHKFIKKIFAGEEIKIYGSGSQTRDFIYVEDICQAIFLALTTDFDKKFNLFQLGTGRETSLTEMIKILKKEFNNYNKPVKINYQDSTPGDIERNFADITKSEIQLGFMPKTPLETGLKKTIKWFSQELKERNDKKN